MFCKREYIIKLGIYVIYHDNVRMREMRNKNFIIISILLCLSIAYILASFPVRKRIKLKKGEDVASSTFVSSVINEHDQSHPITSEQSSPYEYEELLIPVYEEYDLLYDTNGVYWLGIDGALFRYQNAGQMHTDGIIHSYPTEAIRQRDETTRYFIYESDTSKRLYLFFTKNSMDYGTLVGYPMIISQVHSYSDFQSLKQGDDMSKVEEIDDITSCYRYMFDEFYHMNSVGAENRIKDGYPLTSVHYLNDGILMIEWTMDDDTYYKIHDIKYDKDYNYTNMYGETDNYRILDQDLP